MAIFKVGQRVKKIAYRHPEDGPGMWPTPVGAIGTVRDLPGRYGDHYVVLWDAHPSPHPTGECLVKGYQMAPLTDSKADEFIEMVKRWRPYTEPVMPRETVK